MVTWSLEKSMEAERSLAEQKRRHLSPQPLLHAEDDPEAQTELAKKSSG
jgi:hypothetical protein